MDILHSIAHLQREIGDERFNALISSNNTEAVRQFAQGLIEKALPKEMIVGGRAYEILGFLREGEKSIVGHTMVERAKEMNANLGEDDGQHLLNHQGGIPVALRGKAVFVFPGWRHPDDPESACCVCWDGGRWVRLWGWLDDGYWGGCDRLLRRK